METTGKEVFTFGHGSFDAPIVVSNASSIASPSTHPHPNKRMAETDSISNNSEASSIFGAEQDGRCLVLREKRQHITKLYAKWVTQHAEYAHFSLQEIEKSDDIFEAVLDIDMERGQICRALIDCANHARKVFDQTDASDREKLYYVAKNGEMDTFSSCPICW